MVQIGTFAPQGWRLELRGVKGGAAQWARLEERRADARADRLRLALALRPLPHRAADRDRADVRMLDDDGGARGGDEQASGSDSSSPARSTATPGYLAKVSACVDVISGGRVDVGLGAGWKQDEFDAYEYPFPKIRERLDRMADTARILKAMWTEERATVTGKYLSIKNAVNEPKPLQRAAPAALDRLAGPEGRSPHGGRARRGLEPQPRPGRLRGEARHPAPALQGRRPRSEDDARLGRAHLRHLQRRRRAPGAHRALLAGRESGSPQAVPRRSLHRHAARRSRSELNFYIERGAELIILWFQDLADVGSGTSMAERFMREVKPLLKKGV